MVFFDPDGEEIHRAPFSDDSSLKSAMEAALKKYGPKEITWTDRPSGQKPVVLVFADDKKDSEELLKNLADRMLVKLQDKFEFVKQTFTKDSDEVKKWNVLQVPTIIIYDGTKEIPEKAVLERLGGKKSPAEIKKAFAKALKALEKK